MNHEPEHVKFSRQAADALPYTVPMSLRVTRHQYQALLELREIDGIPIQEHVRRAIDVYVDEALPRLRKRLKAGLPPNEDVSGIRAEIVPTLAPPPAPAPAPAASAPRSPQATSASGGKAEMRAAKASKRARGNVKRRGAPAPKPRPVKGKTRNPRR